MWIRIMKYVLIFRRCQSSRSAHAGGRFWSADFQTILSPVVPQVFERSETRGLGNCRNSKGR